MPRETGPAYWLNQIPLSIFHLLDMKASHRNSYCLHSMATHVHMCFNHIHFFLLRYSTADAVIYVCEASARPQLELKTNLYYGARCEQISPLHWNKFHSVVKPNYWFVIRVTHSHVLAHCILALNRAAMIRHIDIANNEPFNVSILLCSPLVTGMYVTRGLCHCVKDIFGNLEFGSIINKWTQKGLGQYFVSCLKCKSLCLLSSQASSGVCVLKWKHSTPNLLKLNDIFFCSALIRCRNIAPV